MAAHPFLVMSYRRKGIPMKTSIIVLAVLLAATQAFAQYGSGQGSPGATMQDYRTYSIRSR